MSDNRATYPNDFGATDDSAPFDPLQAAPESVEYQAVQAALEGTGVVSGLTLAQGGGMTANVDRGFISIQGQQTSVPPATVTFGANPTGFARRDSVRAGLLGVYVVEGDARAIPVSKPLHRDGAGHVDEVLLATVLVPPGAPEGILDEHIVHQGAPPAAASAQSAATPTVYLEPIVTDSNPPVRLAHNGMAMDFMYYDRTPGFQAYYIVWANSSRELMLGVRPVAERLWKVTNLSGVSLFGIISNDAHFNVNLGLDADGFIHLAGNSHTGPLKYVRSDHSMRVDSGSGLFDIGGEHSAAFTKHANMSGINEDHITFPVFFTTSDGTLFYMATQAGDVGTADSSNCTLKRHEGGGVWTELGRAAHTHSQSVCITDGEEHTVTMFPGSIMVDADDDLHIIFNWRDNEAPGAFGQGWWYVKLTGLLTPGNNIQGWRVPDGTDEVTLPCGHYTSTYYAAHPEHLPARVASFTAPGLLNNPAPFACRADAMHYPHTGFTYIVGTPSTTLGQGGGLQQFHLWYNPTLPESPDARILNGAGQKGVGWHVQQMSHFVTNGASWTGSGTPAGSASRPVIACFADGKVLGLFCWPNEGFSGATWAYDLTQAVDDVALDPAFRIHELPDQADFHFDANSLLDNMLRMNYQTGGRYWHNPADPDVDPAVAAQVAPPDSLLGLIHADMARVGFLKSRLARLPEVRRVGSTTASNLRDVTVTDPTGDSTLIQNAGNVDGTVGGFIIGPEYAGKFLVVRLKAMMSVTGGGSAKLMCAVQANNYQEINAQVLQVGEAGDAVPVVQTPVNQTDPLSAFQQAIVATLQCVPDDPLRNIRSSGWAPLPNFRDLNGGLGRVVVSAWVSGGGSGTINHATIEIGYIDF